MADTGKKIVFVANTARSFLLFRADLIRHYVQKGHKVYCIAPSDGTADGDIAALGADFRPVALTRSGLNPLQEVESFRALYRHISNISPDFIVSYTIKPNTYVPVIASLLDIPCLAVVTGLGYAFMSKSIKAKIAATVFLTGLKRADNVWFLNEADKTILGQIAPALQGKSGILPGEGIDPAFYAPAPKQEKTKTVFLMIARLLKDKGILEYAAAAKRLKQVRNDVEFRVLGDLDAGNPTGLSAAEWDALLGEGDVTYIGSCKDVRPHIAASSCIVLPSYREGLPRVLLEGASMGKPMVATDVPGCNDIVTDGHNGFLCRAFDEASLTDSLGKFLDLSGSQRADMGDNARRTVLERFSTNIVLQQYDDLILANA